jgi:hypothetical protein
MIGSWINDRAGVVWDQQRKQGKENPERTSHMPTKLTPEIINAAIVGFEQQKLHIDAQIAELRATMLSGGSTEAATTPEGKPSKRKISAAARRRMALGQKARWAKLKGESEPSTPATPESPKPKRKMSAAGRKAISEATKKRWAAFHAAEAKPVVAKKAAAKKTNVKKAVAKKVTARAARAKKVTAPTEAGAQTA